jgi:hypothetical protein
MDDAQCRRECIAGSVSAHVTRRTLGEGGPNRNSPRIKLRAKPFSLSYISNSNRRKFAISDFTVAASSSARHARRSLGEGGNCPVSNRYCLRIEIPVTYTKQSSGNFLIVTQNAKFCTENMARSISTAALLSPSLTTRHSPPVTPEWYNYPLRFAASNSPVPKAGAGKRKIA